jgi:PAS domain S-box-containing protein
MNTNDGVCWAPLELRAFIDRIPALAWSARPDGFPEFVNQRLQDYSGLSSDQVYGEWKSILHGDDAEEFENWWRGLQNSGKAGQTELRLRRFDGEYRWFQISAAPFRDEQGNLVRWCGINTDIDDHKRAEQELRQKQEDLRTITDAIRQSIVVLAPDGTTLYANRVALDHTGLSAGEVSEKGFLARAFHPDDVERVREERRIGLLEGLPFELEMRTLFRNGQYRWQLIQYNPLRDEHGLIIRWYATATDIDDQKSTEERLRNENLVLREEIDRSSMFEEIVGSCKPMRQVLKQVEKVAPSDSTVLILGETGTGKELIARALHRRSKRAARAFIRGLTDFGPGRSKLFGNSTDEYLKVHHRGRSEVDVTEGSGGIWERLHYDWSDPNRVVLTTTNSSVWGGASGHTYTFTRQPNGTTDIDASVVRKGKNLKGRVLGLVLRTIGRRALEKAFENSSQPSKPGTALRESEPHPEPGTTTAFLAQTLLNRLRSYRMYFSRQCSESTALLSRWSRVHYLAATVHVLFRMQRERAEEVRATELLLVKNSVPVAGPG